MKCSVMATVLLWTGALGATPFHVVDEAGRALASVMVSEAQASPQAADTSDNGYPVAGKQHALYAEVTSFTNQTGDVVFPHRQAQLQYRFRKHGYKDHTIKASGMAALRVTMKRETDPVQLAEAKPANAWLGTLDLGDAEAKKHFQMQCGFCHQQGNTFTRRERSADEWSATIKRMIRYGSRLPTDLQKSLPEKLSSGYRKLRENPSLLPAVERWGPDLAGVVITEWPIGNSMSQMHDMVSGLDGLIYVADNVQDRLYQINPRKSTVSIFKIPHRPGDAPGGLISGRLKDFPRHESTSNAHSLAVSKTDGHVFITPSAQRRLIEFDPKTNGFLLHEMEAGFYPHTIRIDQKDQVWFTLALSNQVAKFDRAAQKFTLYDLPARSTRESLTIRFMGILFKLINWGLPLSNWLSIDRLATGTPLPYGIDITPDGMVWFSRLHTKEIGSIDPSTGKVTMIETPFLGPRRLRSDSSGNLWITVFGESKIARYSPETGTFSLFDLPVLPLGSETPYALNVDSKRNIVWVTGNQSNALFVFGIKKQTWKTIPLPRRTTFTRDFEIMADGTVYTSNSNFPAWHIEGAQPTLIRVQLK